MTNKETVNRNIGLAFDFMRDINDSPQMLNKIPDNTTIDFIEKDFPKTERSKTSLRRKYVVVKNEFELH